MFGFVLTAAGHLPWKENVAITAPLTVVLAFVCLSPWYSCRFLPLSSTPVWKLLLHHLVAAMCASTIVCVIVRMIVLSIRGVFPGIDQRFQPALPVIAGMVGLVYLLSIALHYVMLTVETSRQVEVLSREAELKALKAQVNPHFLFNSLHSISALTSVDAARAREMCICLSDFLRTSLRLGERTAVPFAEELALTRSYLGVEQVRFGDRLRVRQEVDPECTKCDVPPLILQPLVENAIKHGIATLIEGGEIVISGKRFRGGVRFAVENAFDPDAPSTQKSGFGLRNVRNRLQARYGAAARLEIQVERDRYRVIVSVPMEAPEEAVSVQTSEAAL